MVKTLRFLQEIATVYASRPDWTLPNTLLFENCSFALRQFRKGTGEPILVVPPNAGHHSSIAEKLIEMFMEEIPNAPIYSIDWIPASPCNASKSDSVTDLHDYVAQSVETIGRPVHLVGLCQGGWLAAIYTALHQDKVKSLIVGASPIDFHAATDESKIQSWLQQLPLSFFQGLVALGGGVHLGDMQLAGFRLMNPYDRFVGDYVELWNAVYNGDEKAIARWRRNHIWYDNPQSIGGTWYLEVVEKLFKQNLLVKKQLEVAGQIVDLANITCPVFMIAGAEDDITYQRELFGLAEQVSSKDVKKVVLPDCGHVGVFVRDQSIHHWKEFTKEAYASMEEAEAAQWKHFIKEAYTMLEEADARAALAG
jgi:polyhydroxyalkanoate depolymerase